MSRREFILTAGQVERIKKASAPTPAMCLSGGQPMFGTPQENANAEWQRIGNEIGARWDTIRPVPGKGENYISAEPLGGD